jgi:DNA-binding response OmpR family regulator
MRPEDNPRADARPSRGPLILLYGEERENEAIAAELSLDGFELYVAGDCVPLEAHASQAALVIFGRASKRGAGLDVLRALRAGALAVDASGVRVLWVSMSSEPIDVLRAFDAGADDVVRAPFVYAELLARVRALMRRPELLAHVVLCYEALEIDTAAWTATYDEKPIVLRRLEYRLLVHLARDPIRVYTKAELLREVWGYPPDAATRTVDSHASRLRRSLAQAGANGWISSTWGVGYSLAPATAKWPKATDRRTAAASSLRSHALIVGTRNERSAPA